MNPNTPRTASTLTQTTLDQGLHCLAEHRTGRGGRRYARRVLIHEFLG